MSKSININLPPDERLAEIYSEFYEKECPIEAFPSLIKRVAESIHLSHNLPMELLCFIACGIISGAMGSRFKACDAVGKVEQELNNRPRKLLKRKAPNNYKSHLQIA